MLETALVVPASPGEHFEHVVLKVKDARTGLYLFVLYAVSCGVSSNSVT